MLGISCARSSRGAAKASTASAVARTSATTIALWLERNTVTETATGFDRICPPFFILLLSVSATPRSLDAHLQVTRKPIVKVCQERRLINFGAVTRDLS